MEKLVEALKKIGEYDIYYLFEKEFTTYMDLATKILGYQETVNRDTIDKMLLHFCNAIMLGSRIKTISSFNWILEPEERDMINNFIIKRIESMRQKLIDVILFIAPKV